MLLQEQRIVSPETDSGFVGSEASRVSPPVQTPEHRPPGTRYGSGSLPSPRGDSGTRAVSSGETGGTEGEQGWGERWRGCGEQGGCAGGGPDLCRVAQGQATSNGVCPRDPSRPQDPWLAGTLHRHPRHPPSSAEEGGDPAPLRDGADGHLPLGRAGGHGGAPPAPQHPLAEQLSPALGRERGQRSGTRG